MTSSYRLKDGATGYGDMDDWEYVAGLGDLDRCNGAFGPAPEAAGGIYHYRGVLKSGDGRIGIPYFLLCYFGRPDPRNFSVVVGGPGPGTTPLGPAPPDLREAAIRLGVSETTLRDALGPPPPDLAAASERLGVTEEDLRAALGSGRRTAGE